MNLGTDLRMEITANIRLEDGSYWAEVPALNRAGLYVTSRAMLAASVRAPAFEVQRLVVLGTMVIMVVLVTVLLAGPAFAVGLRKRRRRLSDHLAVPHEFKRQTGHSSAIARINRDVCRHLGIGSLRNAPFEVRGHT